MCGMLNVLLGNLSAPERTFDLLKKKKTKRLNGFALSLASPIRKKKNRYVATNTARGQSTNTTRM